SDLGVVHDDKGVDLALAGGLYRVPLEAVTVDTHRCRRVAQGLTGGAALDQQLAGLAAFPEEPGVVTDARQWSLVPGWLGLLLCRLGGFRALRRLELEYPEHLPADLLIRTTVLSLGEVTHHQDRKSTRLNSSHVK